MTAKKAAKKKTRNRRLGGSDKIAYRIVTYVYYVDDQPHYDTAIDDKTLTDFLLEINEHFERPSIIFSHEISKEQYTRLEAAMDSVEDGDDSAVSIGGGLTARVLPEEVDFSEAVNTARQDNFLPDPQDPLGAIMDGEGMHPRVNDPDDYMEGDMDLNHDESGLDDSDFEE